MEGLDVNDSAFEAWGFRQYFSPAHVALDPQFPYVSASLKDRLAVIDLLAQMGADFNSIPSEGLYQNPPLTAGTTHTTRVPDYQQLQARAILHGADPELKGSSFFGISLDSEKNSYFLAFLRLHAKDMKREGISTTPVESVQNILAKDPEDKVLERMKELRSVSKTMSSSSKAESSSSE
ncbi:MAG: hypothetical protein HON43_04180 [Alphaproteobacteria bacterium]|nr:hypothetical protein [Alphaproteobacteria bacterium]MBT5389877.1 hypothetical protein [Alphaproteobacteria bacterium]MBT5540843.1 hypothetical protein [Alphaproteobacteria bacterium]